MANTKIALIDVEDGYRPVSKLIEAGKVELFPCGDANDVENSLVQIHKRADEFHRVIFDTLTHLQEVTINDLMLNKVGRLGKIWSSRSNLKAGFDEYGTAATALNMLVGSAMELKNKQMEVFVLCHEGEREDPYEGQDMHGPDLQRKILRFNYGMADMIVRLAKLPQKGKIGDKEYPVGTRVLRTIDTPRYMAKTRETFGKTLPELIAEPAVGKLFGLCEVKPRKVVVYGPSGHGKTVFACSE